MDHTIDGDPTSLLYCTVNLQGRRPHSSIMSSLDLDNIRCGLISHLAKTSLAWIEGVHPLTV